MRRFERVSFVLGLLLLCWFVFHLGPEQVARGLADLGWGFAFIFVLQAVPLGFLTVAWQLVVPPGPQLPLTPGPHLVAGEAVNAVSPVAVVGGELMRASLLSARIPAQSAVPSVALAAMTQFCAQLIFVLAGLPFALTVVHEASVRHGLFALETIFAVLLGGLLLISLTPAAQRWVERTADRWRWLRTTTSRFSLAWRITVPGVIRAIRERPGRFGLSVLASLLAWLMGAVETFFILRFLRISVPFGRAVGIEVLAVTIEGVLFFVPAKVGVQEGGKVLIFLAAGLNPAKGLALDWPVGSRARLGRRRPGVPGSLPAPAGFPPDGASSVRAIQ